MPELTGQDALRSARSFHRASAITERMTMYARGVHPHPSGPPGCVYNVTKAPIVTPSSSMAPKKATRGTSARKFDQHGRD